MSKRSKSEISARLPLRRGFSETEAAVYLSLSPSFFRTLVARGIMPPPRIIGGRRVWDIDELDAAFKAIPHEGHDGSIYDQTPANSFSDFE